MEHQEWLYTEMSETVFLSPSLAFWHTKCNVINFLLNKKWLLTIIFESWNKIQINWDLISIILILKKGVWLQTGLWGDQTQTILPAFYSYHVFSFVIALGYTEEVSHVLRSHYICTPGVHWWTTVCFCKMMGKPWNGCLALKSQIDPGNAQDRTWVTLNSE